MSLHILLLYATSEWLGILQFNVPNLVAQAHIDAISLPTPSSLRKTMKMKMVSFKDLLTSIIPKSHCNPSLSPCGSSKRKTAKTVTFMNPIKDHTPISHALSIHFNIQLESGVRVPWQQMVEASSSTPQLQSALKLHIPDLTEAAISPNEAGWGIVALKCTFSSLFDTIGNMLRSYTIRTDPNVALVQHARRKVPIEY